MRDRPTMILPATLVLALSLAAVGRADDVRTETVHFDKGTSGTKIEDRLQGYESVQYLLGASAGQHMTVEMATDNSAAYFNIFEPGKTPGNDQAMFIGSIAGPRFDGLLPADGEYMIQVYLMRSAARRDEVASYALEVAIVDAGAVDAKVAGTDFHATGQVPCARYEGQPMGRCEFGVERQGGGDAELTIFWGDGTGRIIYFEDGAPVSSNAGEELKATMQSDLHLITIGAERFEVFDAIIVGG